MKNKKEERSIFCVQTLDGVVANLENERSFKKKYTFTFE